MELDEFQFEGISTTTPFIRGVLISGAFKNGEVHTKLIETVLV